MGVQPVMESKDPCYWSAWKNIKVTTDIKILTYDSPTTKKLKETLKFRMYPDGRPTESSTCPIIPVRNVVCGPDEKSVENCGPSAVNGVIDPERWKSKPHGVVGSCQVEPIWIELDLGVSKNIDKVILWHWFGDERSYCGQKVDISADGETWTTVWDTGSSYGPPEWVNGHTIKFA